ncbi:hypothetical protein J4402_00165 [Candidatus Pacearchaeota archaeon]|nr:hypothetical protein [Candidatus Pacearchaeota archaeon]
MGDEIYYGLKNALERGQSLNAAVQSFINAGYNPVEVREAEKMISSDGGVSSITGEANDLNAPVSNENFEEQKAQPLPKSGFQPKSSGSWKKVLLIILIIVLILIILGTSGFLVYNLLP